MIIPLVSILILTLERIEPNNDQVRILPHGFIFRPLALPLPKNESTKNDKYRHFLSDRDFEDILAACRPRNHGEYMSALPSALVATLKIFNRETSRKEPVSIEEENEMKADLHQIRDISLIPPSVNMNDTVLNSKGFKFVNRSHDIETLSFSFNSAFSFLRECKPTNTGISSPLLEAVQIQQLSAFDIPLLHLGSAPRDMARSKSNESLSTRGEDSTSSMQMKFAEDQYATQYNPSLIVNQFREFMLQYDMSVYDKNIHGEISPSLEKHKATSMRRCAKSVHCFWFNHSVSCFTIPFFNTIIGRSASKRRLVVLAQP